MKKIIFVGLVVICALAQAQLAPPRNLIDKSIRHDLDEISRVFEYQYGECKSMDEQEANQFFRRIKSNEELNPVFDPVFTGLMFYQAICVPGDYHKARILFREQADKDNPLAQYMLGLLYYHGHGVTKNYTTAKEWFEKSAAQNASPAYAQATLGLMYYEGRGIPQDYLQAEKLLESATEKQHIYAMYLLGIMYLHGQGVTQNSALAEELIEQAASLHNTEAQQARAQWLKQKINK